MLTSKGEPNDKARRWLNMGGCGGQGMISNGTAVKSLSHQSLYLPTFSVPWDHHLQHTPTKVNQNEWSCRYPNIDSRNNTSDIHACLVGLDERGLPPSCVYSDHLSLRLGTDDEYWDCLSVCLKWVTGMSLPCSPKGCLDFWWLTINDFRVDLIPSSINHQSDGPCDWCASAYLCSTDASRGHRSRLFGWRGTRSGSLGPPPDPRSTSMAASLGILREAGHSSLNETLKQHNGVTFKLVKTGESKTLSTSRIGTELCVVITLLGQLMKAITVKPWCKRIQVSRKL